MDNCFCHSDYKDELALLLKDKPGETPLMHKRNGYKHKNGKLRTSVDYGNMSHQQIDHALTHQRGLTDSVIDSIPGAFFMLDKRGKVLRWNEELESKFGYSPGEIRSMRMIDFVHPEDQELVIEKFNEVFEQQGSELEIQIVSKKGESFIYRIKANKFVYQGESFVIGSGIDITDQKIADYKLRESLREKQILLQEIHHRVKNNLALVSGLLDMQASESKNEEAKAALLDSKMRIFSIAKIHEMLYQYEELHEINFAEYIKQFSDAIISTHNTDHLKLSFNFELDPICLVISQAIPCAMILNEVITNSQKHAFHKRGKGNITIQLTETDDWVTFTISDNGKGLPDGLDLETSPSLGTTLIRTLVNQIDAQLSLSSSSQGTEYTIKFKRSNYSGPSKKL